MPKKPVKCVFMGSDPIVLPSLNALFSQFQDQVSLEAVFTQPDRRTGRGKKLTPNAIKLWAIEKDIPCFQPEKMGEEQTTLFREKKWDLALVMAYGHILKQDLLDTPKYGFYNLHASILPKLRGASPIETAIVTGEQETGVTLMKVVKALDAGPMVAITKQRISSEINALDLRARLAESCVGLLEESLPKILTENPNLVEQDNTEATYCRLIDKNDGFVDFSLSSSQTLDHIRGFYPWPGALFAHNGNTLKIGSATETEVPNPLKECTPGTMLCADKKLFIKCGSGAISVLSLQKPGGKMLPIADFLNGYEFENGTVIEFPERFPLTKNKYFRKPK